MHLNGYLRHLNADGPHHQGLAVKCSSAGMTRLASHFHRLHELLTCYILSTSTYPLVGGVTGRTLA